MIGGDDTRELSVDNINTLKFRPKLYLPSIELCALLVRQLSGWLKPVHDTANKFLKRRQRTGYNELHFDTIQFQPTSGGYQEKIS